MPRYDYRCTICETVYEVQRAMSDADAPVTCPSGHVGAVRLLPLFATTGLAAEPAGGLCGAPVAGGCGGGCACHSG